MNTLILWRVRSARLTWLTSMLLVLLSRTPVLRILASVEFSSGPRLGEILRALVPVALATGAVHAVTGATQFTSNPSSPAPASVGQPFNLVFAVTGAPSTVRCYSVDGPLPAGLSVPNASVSGTNRTLNASTGSITGTPTESGSFTVAIRAWESSNRGGKSSPAYNVTINVSGAASTAPAFATQPTSATVTAGSSATFTVVVTGTPAPTLQWRKGGSPLAGRTTASLTLTNVTSGDAGSYDCVASNSASSATSTAATLTVNPATAAPAFTLQPVAQTTSVGGTATFTVAVSGSPAPSLQWRFGGANLLGRTGTTLTLANVQPSQAGVYDCVATNSAGSATSTAAQLTVSAAAAPTIISQPVSMTSKLGSGASFTVFAEGTGLSYQWRKNDVPIAGATRSVYSISAVQSADAGSYAVVVTNGAGQSTTSTSVTLSTPASGSARLVNLSSRAGVGANTSALIPGLVIEGDVALTVLLRGVGSGLQSLGVANTVADPVLTLFRGTTPIASNDDWGQAPDPTGLSSTSQAVGAFALAPGSTDAALLVSLPPGVYTVQVGGKAGNSGEALAEIYVVGPD